MTNLEIAQSVLNLVGGQENLKNFTHCATRLRINLFDLEKANLEDIKAIDGVITVQVVNEQLQVVLAGKVVGVYNEFSTLVTNKVETTDEDNATDEKSKFSISKLIEVVAGIFSPTLPILIGCGMIQSISALLTSFNLVDKSSDLFILMQMSGDIIFYFLPFFLAVSAAKKFKVSEYMALAVAGVFMHPIIMNGAMMAAETGVTGLSLFGLPLLFFNYKSTVFPIIITVWVLSHVNRYIQKIIPETFQILLVPVLTLLVMIPLQLGILGPIGSYLGVYIAKGVGALYSFGGFVGAFILGALRPVLVMFGMHYAITPIMVQEIAETGVTMILPALLLGNLAQSGAAFGTAFLIKEKKEKASAFSAAFTAFLGITEPAMYGFNLKFKKPFYAALLSAGVAAAYVSLFGAYSTGIALPGILSLSTYHASSFIHIIIGVVIAVGGAFVLTLLLGIDQKNQ